jgi:hypothetical protein
MISPADASRKKAGYLLLPALALSARGHQLGFLLIIHDRALVLMMFEGKN